MFNSNRDGTGGVYLRRADGTGPVEVLMTGPNNPRANAWAGDGQQLVLIQGGLGNFDRLRLASDEGVITIMYLYFWRESAINLAWLMNARIPRTILVTS